MLRCKFGLALANSLGVVIGSRLGKKLPMEIVEKFAAAVFILVGAAILYGALSPQTFYS